MNPLYKAGIAGGVLLAAGAGVYACTRSPEINTNNANLKKIEVTDLRASQIGDQIRQAAMAVYPYDAFKQSAVDRYAELEKKRY
ncbi:hypothetical protein IT412_03480 [Candidatus Peregrinibacteria bacterium]|nr:hypothetical protein [Candidatus Peregrinibacteria bacterium]